MNPIGFLGDESFTVGQLAIGRASVEQRQRLFQFPQAFRPLVVGGPEILNRLF